MVEENIRSIDETRNCLSKEIKEINQNELMSEKNKQVHTALNIIEHFLILNSTITGSISISSFASLIGIHLGIASSAIR